MLGRIVTVAFQAIVLLSAAATMAEARPPKAHIVIDAASGQVLLSSAPDQQIRPASLTKMMTLYLLFDDLKAGRLKLGSRIRFSKRASRQPPTKLGVRAGGSITVKTAILALSVKSANDVAVAVAERLSGSVDKFADRMNDKARELGMSRTNFANPSGLPHRAQISTPRDMALLARALRYRHKNYYKYFKAESFRYGKRTYRTHNRFVQRYKGADGLKTGYINASGFNLAASAVRNERRLIGVIVGGRSAAERDKALGRLMDGGFRISNKIRHKPAYAGVVPVSIDFNTGRPATPRRRPGQGLTPAPAGDIAALVATSTASPDGKFSAQVGAVGTKRAAERLAKKQLLALGQAVEGGAPKVAALKLRSGKRLYRARIAGLTGKQARQACAKLHRAGRDCLVVGPPASG